LSAAQEAEAKASTASVHPAAFALEWMEDPWTDVERAGEWLLEIAQRVQPDLVHLNAYAFGALAWPAPVVVVGHSDVVSWHRAVRGRLPDRRFDAYRRAVAEGLSGADLLVTPTRWLLEQLEEIYAPACRTEVIANGASPDRVALQKQAVVVTVGRVWDEAKNVEALVEIAPRLPWPVIVAGEGAVGAGVRSLGPIGRNEVARLLAGASIFVEPARYEPFGLAALEAAVSRCALVLGDIPSLREVWGDAALYVPPEDSSELERVIRGLIDSPRLLAHMARRAARRAREYPLRRTGDRYLEAYRQLLSRTVVTTG
jgi:glycosyltransferase involved in cell wall biosynthesis